MKTYCYTLALMALGLALTQAVQVHHPSYPFPKPVAPAPKPSIPLPGKPVCPAAEKCSCNCNYATPHKEEHKKEKQCEWTMVFKAVSGNGRDVFDDFLNGGDMNEGVEQAEDITSTMPYRAASIMDKWNQKIIKKVKVEIFKEGVRKTWFLFDGIASTPSSWLDQSNLIASPYETVKSDNLNFDSVEGDAGRERRFFINRNYGGCGVDCGYLVVIDPASSQACSWERLENQPYFLYGKKKDTCSRWNNSGEAGVGDRFVVSVQICDIDW